MGLTKDFSKYGQVSEDSPVVDHIDEIGYRTFNLGTTITTVHQGYNFDRPGVKDRPVESSVFQETRLIVRMGLSFNDKMLVYCSDPAQATGFLNKIAQARKHIALGFNHG